MMSQAPPSMNPWEVHALNYEFQEQETIGRDGTTVTTNTVWHQGQDPVIYPGLYSATGFDVMNILLRVASRPDPKIALGPVDCSVALILCDLLQPDAPIVYASQSFCELTGYSQREIIGRNCRFLQAPPGKDRRSVMRSADKVASHKIRKALESCDEIQLEVTNYKKTGHKFTNILSIVPVTWDSHEYRYAVGFSCALE